jgi:hypothetical protein
MKNAARRVSVLLFAVSLAAVAGATQLTPRWTMSDDASIVQISSRPKKYAFSLVSSEPEGIIGSGLTFHPTGKLKFKQIQELSADFAAVLGGIGGGSPRFSIGIDVNGDGVFQQAADGSGPDGHVFVYLGTVNTGFHDDPSSTWANTGNLIEATDNRFDCNQLGSTRYYDDYATALSLAGNKRVMYISLVVDSGWWFDDQEVLFNNVTVNNSVLKAKKP